MSHIVCVPATAAPDAGPDLGRQTTLTLAHLGERLRAGRSSLADAVVITVYLRRASDFAAMNGAYRQTWRSAPPTRTTVVVDPQRPGADVEISAVAVPAGSDRRPIHPAFWMASPNPRTAFGGKGANTPVQVGLAAPGARVEIMALAERG